MDLVAVKLPWPIVNEGDSFPVDLGFSDREGNALEAPSTIDFRVDDVTNPRCPLPIVAWTTAAPGETGSIQMESAYSAIQNRCRPREKRLLTVRANRDATSQVSGRAEWTVINQGFNP